MLLWAKQSPVLALPLNQSTVLTTQLNDTAPPALYPGISYQCIANEAWYPAGVVPRNFDAIFDDDCEEAYHKMDWTDFLTHHDEPYEFVSSNAVPSRSRLQLMQTPRRCTSGKSASDVCRCQRLPESLTREQMTRHLYVRHCQHCRYPTTIPAVSTPRAFSQERCGALERLLCARDLRSRFRLFETWG